VLPGEQLRAHGDERNDNRGMASGRVEGPERAIQSKENYTGER
jgi:hypothetical protein